MISSVDGKISTGDIDKRDVDKDFKKIKGIKEGLHQYYDLEKRTDIFSFNTGRVMAKIGVNRNKSPINVQSCSFVIVDNTHLTKKGVQNLVNGTKRLYLVTSNKKHPAFKVKDNKEKLEIIYYKKKINFKDLFKKLKQKYCAKRVTIQSGGTLNSILIREKLIDKVSVVIAPCLIGGKDTSTLVDGESLKSLKDLNKIMSLKLEKAKKLKKNYLHIVYRVVG
jgi:2,5-diamino-6-(ribosylamino)-4(3H)-pyrimidinone 5'-phosphate reductase